jgi:hypothetical protein
MRERPDSDPLARVELSDATTPWDQVVMFRVRTRLAAHGLRLRLQAREGGWSWAIADGSQPLSPVFGSLHQALYHADAHTAARYPELVSAEAPPAGESPKPMFSTEDAGKRG